MDLVGVRNVNVLMRPPLPQAVFVPHQAGRQHQDQRDTESCGTIAPVSYTHLTLPTIYSV